MDTVSKDYVFKEIDGQLKYIGDFDGLYRDVEDPWGQNTLEEYKQRRLFIINSLVGLNPKSILDVGCGFGHTTQLINILITKDVLGVDISGKAIAKAKEMFPAVSFETRDILKNFPNRKFDIVLFDSILWYILNGLDNLVKRVYEILNDNGHFVIFQNFIDNQRYGKEIIGGFAGLVKYGNSIKRFTLTGAKYYNQGHRRINGIVVLKKEQLDG